MLAIAAILLGAKNRLSPERVEKLYILMFLLMYGRIFRIGAYLKLARITRQDKIYVVALKHVKWRKKLENQFFKKNISRKVPNNLNTV